MAPLDRFPKGQIRTPNCWRKGARIVFIAAAFVLLPGCGDGDLPEYDKDATYNGKPLSEYTPGLSDLNADQRARALYNITQFGVNALPAREQVRKMAREDPDERVRVAALATLHSMKDPKLPALFASILADPSYTQSAKTWRELIKGVDQVFSDAELAEQMAQIASNNPEHAETLFNAQSGSKLELPLARALLTREVGQRTLTKLMSVLPKTESSSDEKIDFIANNAGKLDNPAAALRALQDIGGDRALKAAMTLADQANALLFDWVIGISRNKQITKGLGDDMIEFAQRAGRLILDESIDQAHVERFFSRTELIILATQAPSTDAIIAFVDPMAMSQDPKFTGRAALRAFEGILSTNIYYLKKNPDQPRYVEWVQKVAKEGHEALRPLAEKGLKQYAT
jgi:hypothetical protein